MKTSYLILIILLLSNMANSQEQVSDTSSSSKVIADLSYFWKLDSLANNGFRLATYKRILDSKTDSNIISRPFLVNNLGQPNRISKSNKGVEYIYFVLDGKKMLKEFAGRVDECVYISFMFDKYDKYLLSKDSGVLDY